MKSAIACVLCLIFVSLSSWGQFSTSYNSNIRRNVATVMFAGLGGAVLGLSTLSFYGEPQDHIGNIWLGLGIGAIAGTAYVLTDSRQQMIEARPNKTSFPVLSWHWEF
jgi:hypothetical protein